jgi:DNA integrity scanning protein DisA with diadenylate cyclase activity
MSIKNTIRIINRVNAIVTDMQAKYTSRSEASHELSKLNDSLAQLLAYLNKLDQLAPNYNTDEVDNYVNSINVNLAILKGEMEVADYKKLSKGIQALKTVLRFHPVKYSFFTFIIAWFVELIYFI